MDILALAASGYIEPQNIDQVDRKKAENIQDWVSGISNKVFSLRAQGQKKGKVDEHKGGIKIGDVKFLSYERIEERSDHG
jgi:hypothetical protein